MRQDISKLIDEIKDQIEKKVMSILGPAGSVHPSKTVDLMTYDDICDDFYPAPYIVVRIFVEDERVLVTTRDSAGDKEENYLRDYGLGDIEQIVSIL